MAIEKLKAQIPGFDQTPTELNKAGGKRILSEIHKPINSI